LLFSEGEGLVARMEAEIEELEETGWPDDPDIEI